MTLRYWMSVALLVAASTESFAQTSHKPQTETHKDVVLKLTAEQIFEYVERVNKYPEVNRKLAIEQLQLALDGKLIVKDIDNEREIESDHADPARQRFCFLGGACPFMPCSDCRFGNGHQCHCSLCCVARPSDK